MTLIKKTELLWAFRRASLPQELWFFQNLLRQFRRNLGQRCHGQNILPEYCFLLFLQTYIQILCPYPDGEDKFFTSKFGRIFDAVLGANHPEFAQEVKTLWINSQWHAASALFEGPETVH